MTACERLTGILLAPHFIKYIETITAFTIHQLFYSLIIRFSPKNVSFSFKVMLARYKKHYSK